MIEKPTYEDLEIKIAELEKQIDFLKMNIVVKSDGNSFKTKFEESENIFKQLVENIDEVFWLRTDSQMICINPAFEKIWGFPCKDIYDNPQIFTNTIHPDDIQSVMDVLNSKEFIEKGFFDLHYRIVRPDKQIRWIHAKSLPVFDNCGKVVKRVGIARDVTDKILYENELIQSKRIAQESELKFRLMYENTSIGIAVISLQFVIIAANKAYCDMLGYAENELIGKTLADITHNEIIQKNIELQTQLKDGVIPSFQLEKSFIHKDGHTVYGLLNATLIKNTQNEPLYFLGNVQDITDRKIVEQELILSKEKAVQSDQLKTAFLQNLSHEIRTPLNAICGLSGLLNKPGLTSEKCKRFVSVIQSSSNQLLSIVSDVITIASLETKQERVYINKVCINSVLSELFEIFKLEATSNNISLRAKPTLTDEQSEIYTDKTKITQILTNLISNAMKFTQKGFVEFGYDLKNNELEFFVKDTGVGIQPEFHEVIFECFRQADVSVSKKHGGTGLGLSISKGFVELLGGRIWLVSKIDCGSTFYFTIPYSLSVV